MAGDKETACPLILTPEETPDKETSRAISAGLNAYNDRFARQDNLKALWVVGRDEHGAVQAGLYGSTVYDWLVLHWLWVDETYRGQGVGSKLLLAAEAIARERSCTACYLDTFSFQAPGFYQRQGYREIGRVNGFPPGFARIWFSKSFNATGPSTASEARGDE